MAHRLLPALRFALLVAVLLGAVGAAGHVAGTGPLGGTWLTAALGPTAYVLLARPGSPASSLREGVIAHVVALVVGLGALAAFGLWNAPSIAVTHQETWTQVGAQAVALAVTLWVIDVLGADQAPAAATTLLVTSGIAAPGRPLLGLVVGLAVVLLVAPLLARLPGGHGTAGAQKRSGSASFQSATHGSGGSASS